MSYLLGPVYINIEPKKLVHEFGEASVGGLSSREYSEYCITWNFVLRVLRSSTSTSTSTLSTFKRGGKASNSNLFPPLSIEKERRHIRFVRNDSTTGYLGPRHIETFLKGNDL
jgi:hypothetical protein